MSEWQPIDTAPKDGSRFFAYWPDAHIDWCHWQKAEYEEMPEGWRDGFIYVYKDDDPKGPTHWMPLPRCFVS
jgi:hypothetical protein